MLIAGCHPGDCHYTSGNVKTIRRFKLLQKMLDQFGVERDRVRFEWVSASEGERYAEVVENMTDDTSHAWPSELERSKGGLAMANPKAAFYWAASCGGCEIAILELGKSSC